MPQIKGSLGSIVIASENIAQGGNNVRKISQRKEGDPVNYIRV